MGLAERITNWIKKQVRSAGAQGVVVGLSGGVDSSVVGVLSKRAFPEAVLGLIMPCFSNPLDLEHAQLVAERFDIQTRLVDLSSIFAQLAGLLEARPYTKGEASLAISNIKPRLRMITLYYFANKFNYLVAGTGNKSEMTMGYFTKYGDGGVDALPLGGLLKSQVRQLAGQIGIPEQIVDKPPSAGLWAGQTDEGEMDITYDQLDKIISGLERNDLSGCDRMMVERVEGAMRRSQHKRQLPPIFEP